MDELGRNDSDDGLHVRLIQFANLTIDASWNAAGVRSTYWRFYVNSRDGASVLLDNGEYLLAARRIHLIPAWVRFTCRNHAPIEHLFAHFDLVGLPGPAVREGFPRPVTLPEDHSQETAARRLAGLVRERALPPVALACEVKAAVYRALSCAITALPAPLAERCQSLAGRSGTLAPALQRIEDAFSTPIANADLARRCGMSEDHFIRRFRSLVGQTPAQFILERRVARAAQRLLLSDDAIVDIAESCGFPDRFYFTRAFTRRMGVAPARYRRTKRV